MKNLKDVIRYDEQVIFKLRSLFSEYGYKQYKMSRFEEYELYAANRAFLPEGDIITFTESSGKLMALRPDVTLSIIKNIKNSNEPAKLYYNENVYRTVNGELKEQMQVGLECIGFTESNQMAQVLLLAKKSLDVLGKNTKLDISHMGFLSGLLRSDTFENSQLALSSLYGPYTEVKARLLQLCVSDEMHKALEELEQIDNELKTLGISDGVNIDFSIVNDVTYYNGIIFQGFIEGVSEKVLSGGRYDGLLKSFGKNEGAIGFALNLAIALRAAPEATEKILSIALPKGRLGEKAYEIFEKAGFECPDLKEDSRKLVYENTKKAIRYYWVKPSDVAIYVERGVADIGVVGKDSLLEDTPDVYELLDLNIGKCRMCVAAQKGFAKKTDEHILHVDNATLRVATKFPNIARRFYTSRGRDIDIIKLYGSVELAPLIGLSDVIVDLVETGKTLEANNMEVIETIDQISARLISNKVSHRFKHDEITKMCEKIARNI